MTPVRSVTINGKIVKEVDWIDSPVIYVESRLVNHSYEEAIALLRANDPLEFA